MSHVDTHPVEVGAIPPFSAHHRRTLKVVLVGSLIVSLTSQPIQALSNETRKTVSIIGLIGVAVGLLLAATIRQSKTVRLIAVDGAAEPLVGRFTRRGMAGSGPVTVSAGPRTFAGKWTQVDSGASLASFLLTTPSGPVTALGLAQAGPPTGVAILEGDGENLLCVWAGSFAAGVVTCADTSGRRYVGTW